MKFVIGKTLLDQNKRSVYELEVEFMHGDADDYDSVEFIFPFNPDHNGGILPHSSGVTLEQAIDLLDRVATSGVRGYREANYKLYMTLPHFETLFDENWPGDKFTDWSVPAAYNGYKLKFYDLTGVPHEVKIER